MTPREYVDEIVRPNLAELVADPASVRLAMNAVHAVDALAARIYVAAGGRETTGEKSDTDFREGLAKADASGNFRLLRDLAKALKHAELERGTPLVSSAENARRDIIGCVSIAGALGALPLASAPLGGSGLRVIVKAVAETTAGEVRAIDETALKALAFLEEEMARRGL